MTKTIVGIFDDYKHARAAVDDLTHAGLKQGTISIAHNEPASNSYLTYGGANSKDYTTATSVGSKISNFFEGLFDSNDDARGDVELYSESVRRGSTVVVARVEDNMVERAADILNQHGAADVDRRAAHYRSAGFTSFDHSAPLYTAEQSNSEFQQFANAGEIALPVIEEQLAVGKRVVQRGGVRVHTHVTERPVQEQVTLHEEHIRVERHPVNRAANEADFNNLRTGEMTMTEHNEVAVVAKEARVVEEVSIGKTTEERVETVSDTVRRTDVQVEEIDADVNLRNKTARNQ